jgi:hypothetical protein
LLIFEYIRKENRHLNLNLIFMQILQWNFNNTMIRTRTLSFILNAFCSRFAMAVPFILPTPLFRRESRRKNNYFIRILFQVFFDFALSMILLFVVQSLICCLQLPSYHIIRLIKHIASISSMSIHSQIFFHRLQ